MKRPRYGRPDRASLFGTMLINALAGSVVLYLACTLFGVNAIVIGQFARHGITISERWGVVLPMLPGIGIGMGCLWFWLVLVGRTKGVQWGGAAVYGGILAVCNVPLAALVQGALAGRTFEEILLMMLIALALVMISPALLVAMLLAGGILGLFNARLAHAWIAWYKRGDR